MTNKTIMLILSIIIHISHINASDIESSTSTSPSSSSDNHEYCFSFIDSKGSITPPIVDNIELPENTKLKTLAKLLNNTQEVNNTENKFTLPSGSHYRFKAKIENDISYISIFLEEELTDYLNRYEINFIENRQIELKNNQIPTSKKFKKQFIWALYLASKGDIGGLKIMSKLINDNNTEDYIRYIKNMLEINWANLLGNFNRETLQYQYHNDFAKKHNLILNAETAVGDLMFLIQRSKYLPAIFAYVVFNKIQKIKSSIDEQLKALSPNITMKQLSDEKILDKSILLSKGHNEKKIRKYIMTKTNSPTSKIRKTVTRSSRSQSALTRARSSFFTKSSYDLHNSDEDNRNNKEKVRTSNDKLATLPNTKEKSPKLSPKFPLKRKNNNHRNRGRKLTKSISRIFTRHNVNKT